MFRKLTKNQRKAGVVVLVAVSMALLVSMAAMTVDIGTTYIARTELQVAADAASMTAAWTMMDETRLKGAAYRDQVFAQARSDAAARALQHIVLGVNPVVDLNSRNSANGDIVLGYLSDPTDLSAPMTYDNPSSYNSVQVMVRRDSTRNGAVNFWFAPFFGANSKNLVATATATFRDGIVGYRVNDETGNALLMPLALHIDYWNALLAGTYGSGDNYSYNPDTGAVSAGSDGIREINLYPGAGGGQLPPGNFGTVDIGSPNNSTADISRQIRTGVNESDLAYFGGEMRLGPDGTLILNGDTGLSAAIKDDLMSVIGDARAIPLFNHVEGPGNNSNFTVVGFAGIRVMHVKLTGSMAGKQVVVQPAYVSDNAAIADRGSRSYFVYTPVMLSR